MSTIISMLRGINVGGKKVEMEKLRKDYESLGFTNIKSYIQSGNVLFETSQKDDLAETIEEKIKQSFGLDVAVFIRTENELRKLVENNPFRTKDVTKLHVTFLREEPREIPDAEIASVKGKAEDYRFSGREIYLFCPNGYGRTKLSNSLFERRLKTPATTRNWNTVNTLLSMASSKV
jgi:uncharacterized protein (DUF1697 family)